MVCGLVSSGINIFDLLVIKQDPGLVKSTADFLTELLDVFTVDLITINCYSVDDILLHNYSILLFLMNLEISLTEERCNLTLANCSSA